MKLIALVDYYNHGLYHESLKKLTPADIYYDGAKDTVLENIRRQQ